MIDPRELELLVQNHSGIVSRKASVAYPGLYVLKYKNKVFYKNLWDQHPLLKECRGLVVDSDYNVVSYPFTKIFNYGENGTSIPRDESVLGVRKVNGFLGVVTVTDRFGPVYSTTGSTDSDFAKLVKEHLEPFVRYFEPHVTYMFEIVDPSDPHIIREDMGAYLIGIRGTDGSMMDPKELYKEAPIDPRIRVVSTETGRFSDFVKRMETDRTEGYVIYGEGTTLKLKSNYYLVSKFLARKTEAKLREILIDQKETWIDEDYDFVLSEIRKMPEGFISLSEQDRIDRIHHIIEHERNGIV